MATTPKPVPKQPSKEAVNRAGQLVADLLDAIRKGNHEKIERELRPEEIDEAFLVIDWWRSLHAKPLTSVSANLRHYLRPYGPVMSSGNAVPSPMTP